MRLPRDLDGPALAKALGRLGYRVTRQTGSHMRLTTESGGQHHLTVPVHGPLRVGTVAAILDEAARHHGLARDRLMEILFG